MYIYIYIYIDRVYCLGLKVSKGGYNGDYIGEL